MSTISLEITGLTKVFDTSAGPYVAVKDVNAFLKDGEFACIVGHSGCGKSTVLSILAGLQRATFGGVVINGWRWDARSRNSREPRNESRWRSICNWSALEIATIRCRPSCL